MTEPVSAPTATTSKKRKLFLPIAGAIVAIAVGGFFASRAGLDKALVKQQVDNFIVQMKEKGREAGRDLNLTYADLEVVGSFTNKHVVMRSPVFTVKPLERQPDPVDGEKPIDAMRITTPSVEIYPAVSSMTIKMAEPIDFADEDAPEKSLLKLKSNVPHEVVVTQTKMGDVSYNRAEYHAPSQLDFTYLKEQQAQGAEEKAPTVVPVYETLVLTMAQGGTFSSNIAEDKSGLGEIVVNFRDLVATPQADQQNAIKLAEITSKWTNSLNEQKLNVITAQMKVGPITSSNASLPHFPLLLDLDASYQGAMPKNAEAVANIKSPESLMVLKNFELSSKDVAVKANANFTASASDSLPVGTASVSMTNVPFVFHQLTENKLLDDREKLLVLALLAKITGTPTEQIKDIVIPIERARGGAFKIGAATFEELFAVFLQQAMQQPDAAAVPSEEGVAPTSEANPAPSPDESSELEMPLVPTLPPAGKAKLAPIEIPDLSVRG